MTFISVNKELICSNLSQNKLNKIINIYYGEKVKRDVLEEYEKGLYDYLKEEYPTRERLEQALGEIQHFNDLSKDFSVMAINFQISAAEVVDYMASESNIARLDTLFFPMVYLYRQSIELLLKAIYFQEVKDQSERKLFIGRTRHDLSTLYQAVTSLPINPDQDKAGYTWLADFFDNISLFDKVSDSFRYPYRFQMTNDGFDRRLKVKKVFEERKDIDLIKISRKFSYAFALLQRLIKELPHECNENPYAVDKLSEFIENPDCSSEFLEEGGHYYLRCVIGENYRATDFNRYADAYNDCAEYLYKKRISDLMENHKSNISCYHPVCYLLRNAIELSLKKLCARCVQYDEAIELISTKKHNLHGLWNGSKDKHAEGPMNFISIPHSDQIDFYVKLVNEVDETSSRFRYPTDNNLERYNPDPYRYHFGIHYYLLSTCFNRIRNTEYIIDEATDGREGYRELRM